MADMYWCIGCRMTTMARSYSILKQFLKSWNFVPTWIFGVKLTYEFSQKWSLTTSTDPSWIPSPLNPLSRACESRYIDPVSYPVANSRRCLTQVAPDPGRENNAVTGPGGEKWFRSPESQSSGLHCRLLLTKRRMKIRVDFTDIKHIVVNSR